MSKTDTGKVNIHGKEYETVALRVQRFRESHGTDYSIITEVLHRSEQCVVMIARILDGNGRIIATGHAEEYRTTSSINKTSALENCETSAIGRALAAFGMGGTEFASADEVANAITRKQPAQPEPQPQPEQPQTTIVQSTIDTLAAQLVRCAAACESAGKSELLIKCNEWQSLVAGNVLTKDEVQEISKFLHEAAFELKGAKK